MLLLKWFRAKVCLHIELHPLSLKQKGQRETQFVNHQEFLQLNLFHDYLDLKICYYLPASYYQISISIMRYGDSLSLQTDMDHPVHRYCHYDRIEYWLLSVSRSLY